MTDNDGAITTDSVLIIVNEIEEQNLSPIAADDSADENGAALTVAIGGSLVIDVLSNDSDSDGELDVTSVVASVDQAVVSADDGSITYTPSIDGDTENPATFTYTVSDDDGAVSNVATVTVLVMPAANIAPVAVNDSAEALPAEAVDIDVAANDTDEDGSVVAASVAQGPLLPSHGAISIDPVTGVITYTPNSGVAVDTADEFSYTIEDDQGLVSAPGTVAVTFVQAPYADPVGPVIATHHEMIPNPVYNSASRVSLECVGAANPCNWDDASAWLTGTVPDSDSLVIVDGHVQISDRTAVARLSLIHI